jgi:hypothetical protein
VSNVWPITGMDDPSLLGRGRLRHRRHHVAAELPDQPQRVDRQLDPDRRMRPGADQRIAPCTTLGRPLVRKAAGAGLAGGLRSATRVRFQADSSACLTWYRSLFSSNN